MYLLWEGEIDELFTELLDHVNTCHELAFVLIHSERDCEGNKTTHTHLQ